MKGAKPLVVGRRLKVPMRMRTTRDIIRYHLALDRLTIKNDLARILGIKSQSAASLMTKNFPLAPQHVDRFIEEMKLDEFDALELRQAGAIEAGWQLDHVPTFVPKIPQRNQ